MGRVYELDGPLPSEVVVDELERGIRSGFVLPGVRIPLAELAEPHGLAVSALRPSLHRLVKRALVRFVGTAIEVNAPGRDEVVSVGRMQRLIQADMLVQSAELDGVRVERAARELIEDVDPRAQRLDAVAAIVDWNQMMTHLVARLSQPLSGTPKQRVWQQLMRDFAWHLNLGWLAVVGESHSTAAAVRVEHFAHVHDLVDSFGRGRPALVRETAVRHIDDAAEVALAISGLAPAPPGGVAGVIPLHLARR